MSAHSEKHKIRLELRSSRRSFLGASRRRAEQDICGSIEQLLLRYPKGKIGVYFPFDGEVNVSQLWGESRLTPPQTIKGTFAGRLVFPVHKPNSELTFVEPIKWDLTKNLPIAVGPQVGLAAISILLVPGVAFCPQTGLRIGLGGGHYDRTLALRNEKAWRVHAFGVGFTFQQRTDLPREAWDIPLDGLISDSGFKTFT